jgi:hypothetical protein
MTNYLDLVNVEKHATFNVVYNVWYAEKLPPSSSKATLFSGSFLGMISALDFAENNKVSNIKEPLQF